MFKTAIINALAATFGLRRYLEVCTPTTGVHYHEIDRSNLDTCHRLMYRCPKDFDDGLQIDFRTQMEDSSELIDVMTTVLSPSNYYDLIFVDPYHNHECGSIDLFGAFSLLAPHGVMVVHDCSPTDPMTVGPEFQEGAWCGVTYQAFLEFVWSSEIAGYCTVNSDYGCGVVFNKEARFLPNIVLGQPSTKLKYQWVKNRVSDPFRFKFFEANRSSLLNLIAPDAFQDALRALQAGSPSASTEPSATVAASAGEPASETSLPVELPAEPVNAANAGEPASETIPIVEPSTEAVDAAEPVLEASPVA